MFFPKWVFFPIEYFIIFRAFLKSYPGPGSISKLLLLFSIVITVNFILFACISFTVHNRNRLNNSHCTYRFERSRMRQQQQQQPNKILEKTIIVIISFVGKIVIDTASLCRKSQSRVLSLMDYVYGIRREFFFSNYVMVI